MRIMIVLFFSLLVFDAHGQKPEKSLHSGDVSFDQEEYVDAEEKYRQAAELGSVDVANYNLGNTLAAQGRFEEAVAAFEGAIQLTQDNQLKADAYYNQGNSYANTQKYKEAVESYKKALNSAPDDKAIKQNLSYVIKQLKEQQQQEQQQSDDQQNQSDQQQNQQQNQHQQSNSRKNTNQNNAQQQEQQPLDQQQVDSLLDMMQKREELVQANMRRKNNKMSKSDKDW